MLDLVTAVLWGKAKEGTLLEWARAAVWVDRSADPSANPWAASWEGPWVKPSEAPWENWWAQMSATALGHSKATMSAGAKADSSAWVLDLGMVPAWAGVKANSLAWASGQDSRMEQAWVRAW